jgi:hypothetical protein
VITAVQGLQGSCRLSVILAASKTNSIGKSMFMESKWMMFDDRIHEFGDSTSSDQSTFKAGAESAGMTLLDDPTDTTRIADARRI